NNVSPTHFYNYPDSFTVKLHGVSDKGCQDTLFKEVVVNPFPVVNFTTANKCDGDSVILSNSTTIAKGGMVSTWTLGNGVDTSTYSLNYLYAQPGFYSVKLKVIADAGCRDSITKGVTVYPV